MVRERLLHFNPYSLRLDLLQSEHIHRIVEQLARSADIDSGFHFVTGEYPELHACTLDVEDGLSDLVLELILDRGRPDQIKIDLQLFSHFINRSFFVDLS